MSQLITITEAARSFADLIGRVYYRGEEFDIKKGTQIVAHIGPAKQPLSIRVEDLTNFFARCPSLAEDDSTDFENDIKMIHRTVGEAKDKWD